MVVLRVFDVSSVAATPEKLVGESSLGKRQNKLQMTPGRDFDNLKTRNMNLN